MAALFDPSMDGEVTFEDFLAGFRRIKDTSSQEDAGVALVTACSRVWKSLDFILLTIMSSVSLLTMHGLLAFSLLYQVDVFGGDDDYFLNASADPALASKVSTGTIQ